MKCQTINYFLKNLRWFYLSLLSVLQESQEVDLNSCNTYVKSLVPGVVVLRSGVGDSELSR